MNPDPPQNLNPQPVPRPVGPTTHLQHAHAPNTQLWGNPAHQLQLLPRLHQAGFTPVEPDPTSPPPTQAFLAHHPQTPPAVYHRALTTLRQQHPTPHPPDLLHPVARATHLQLPNTQRFAVTGFSGHGNMLLQAVLRAIDLQTQGPDDQRPRPAWTQQLRQDADHHGQTLRAACQQLFQQLAEQRSTPLHDYTIGTDQLDNCTARAQFQDQHTLIIAGLPHASFLTHDFGAHIRWQTHTPNFFKQFGYTRVYAIVRNPIAGLASNAAKTNRPPEPVLHQKNWFDRCAKDSAQYLQQLQKHREHFKLIRFEDLLQHPIKTIKQLAHDANHELSNEQAQHIWQQVGFQPVTDAGPEHLVDPQADKTQHFRQSQFDWLQDAGLLEHFQPFGYPVPQPNDFPDTPLTLDQAATQKPNPLYGRPDPATLTHAPTQHQADVSATDPPLAQQAAHLVDQPAFVAILRSLGQGLFQPDHAQTH